MSKDRKKKKAINEGTGNTAIEVTSDGKKEGKRKKNVEEVAESGEPPVKMPKSEKGKDATISDAAAEASRTKVQKKKSKVSVPTESAPVKEGDEKPAGKAKRPWRNKVRKVAAKEKSKKEREEAALNVVVPVPAEGDIKKKKKKRSKKKKGPFVNTKKEGEEGDENAADEPQKLSKVEEDKEKIQAARFRYLNEQLYTVKSEEAFELFKKDPDAFHAYHDGFAKQTKKWPNDPLRVITQWLSRKPAGKVVFDMGCGEAKIAENCGSKHDVRSFDLVAVNERVTACDMAHLPVEDSTADIVIFSLSLMGTNLGDFIKEARRVLKTGGTLKIAEVTSRFVSVKTFVEAIVKLGFKVVEKKPLTDYFTLMEFTKIDQVANKRPYGLILKPCLYKKR